MKNTRERKTLKREGHSQVKRNLKKGKSIQRDDRNRGDTLYVIETGVCFESGL